MRLAAVRQILERSLLARVLLCATSGIAFGVAAPPRSAAWLDWIALIPTLYVLRLPGMTQRQAGLLGWVSGLGIGLIGFVWIGETLARFGGFPPLLAFVGLLVYAAWMALPYGFFGLAVVAGPRHGALAWIWMMVAFVGFTWSWPLVFPYTPFIGLAAAPAWMQVAEIGGVVWVEAHVLGASWLAMRALEPGALRPRLAFAGAALAIPLVSWGAGELRMAQVASAAEQAPRAVVGVVQPNVPVLFANPEASMTRLWSASERAQEQGAEWIVWPEAGTYPYALERPLVAEPAEPQARILARHRTPTLFGAVTYTPGDPIPYNTLVYLDAEGRVRGTFDKVVLVPFGESIPFVDPVWLEERIPAVAHLHAGAGPARFAIELDARVVAAGPLICYEDIMPEFARQVAALPGGIEVFVNATIDAWYGASAEPWEHLALAQYRSIEHRIPMVRAVSTGVSSVIDATGRVVAAIPARASEPGEAPPHAAEILVHELSLARNTERDPTWFARIGWVSAPLCRLVLFGGVLVWLVRRLRARLA